MNRLQKFNLIPQGPLTPTLRFTLRRALRSKGTKCFDHFFFQFRWIFTPPTKMSHTTPITIQNVRFYDMMIIWQTVPLRLGVWALCRENLNFQFPLSQNIGLCFPNTQLTTCIHFNWWEKGNQQSLGPSRAWLAPITFEQKWFEKPKGGAGSLCSSLYVADLEPLPFSCQFQSTSNSIDAPWSATAHLC